MKKSFYILSSLFSVTLLLTGCDGGRINITDPQFLNYTEADILKEADFLTMVNDKDKEMAFIDFDYENNSYRIDENFYNKTKTSFYRNNIRSNEEEIILKGYEDLIYDHNLEAINNIVITLLETDDNDDDDVNTMMDETIFKNDEGVILADNDEKKYSVLTDSEEYAKFSNFAKTVFPISNHFIFEQINFFEDYTDEDHPTIFYSRDNVYTTGMVYDNIKTIGEDDSFKEVMSIKAVCQITVNGNNIAVNTQMEYTSTTSDFSDEYIEEHDIDYDKMVITSKYQAVKRLTINGDIEVEIPDLSEYQLIEE